MVQDPEYGAIFESLKEKLSLRLTELKDPGRWILSMVALTYTLTSVVVAERIKEVTIDL